jgi:outer membrane biogenesis lipoprotein LolB
VTLPADPGTPLADFARIHDEVSKDCRAVRTLTAVLRLSARAGSESFRGTVLSKFRRPDSMQLRMNAAFTTIFVLVANDRGATLLLNRDRRVVRDARAEEILDALIGIKLTPDDLQALITGCVVPEPRATGGRQHGSGWISIELDGGTTLYLQRARDVWRLRAARRGDWVIEYPAWQAGSRFPPQLWISTSGPVPVDLRAAIDDVETDVDVMDADFTVPIRDEAPMTLEELRESGLLRSK